MGATALWTAAILTLVLVVAMGAALRTAAWWTRLRSVSRIPPEQRVREARGVTMRVLVQGTQAFPGMSTRNANRTRGDLVLGRDRFVLATNRGLLADLGPGHGRAFTSVRCTGPGRLVIEGDAPSSSGTTGLYRIEITMPDAEGWAEALQPFSRKPRHGASLTTMQPTGQKIGATKGRRRRADVS